MMMKKIEAFILSILLVICMTFPSFADLTTTNILNDNIIYPEGYSEFVCIRASGSATYYACFFNEDEITSRKSYSTGLYRADVPCYTYSSSDFDQVVEFLYATDKTSFSPRDTTYFSTTKEYFYAVSCDLLGEEGGTYLKRCDWIDCARVYVEETTPDTGGDTGGDTGDDTGGDTGDDTGGDTTTDTGYDDSNLLGKLGNWFQGIYDAIVGIPDRIAEIFTVDTEVIDAKMDIVKENCGIFWDIAYFFQGLFDNLIGFDDKTPPQIYVDLSGTKYGDGKVLVADFSFYEEIRHLADPMVGSFIVLGYLYLVFKQAPNILSGAAMVTEERQQVVRMREDMWRRHVEKR